MSAVAIGIFTVVGCIALFALRHVKSNIKQPVRPVAPTETGATPGPGD